MDRDYGHIPELRRAERRRAMKSLPAVRSEQQNTGSDEVTEERQAEGTYSEALLPLVKAIPSAPRTSRRDPSSPLYCPICLPSDPGDTKQQQQTPTPTTPHLVSCLTVWITDLACDSGKVRWSVFTDTLILPEME